MSPAPRVRFVLVCPRNPLNIGAAARAIANFGFSELIAVEPYGPSWREARSAVGAEAILARARRVKTLRAALTGMRVVIATSAGKTRRRDERWIAPLDLRARMTGVGRNGGVAFLFGSEKTGLTNAEIGHAHFVLRIPTADTCPSMNLSHAVCVVAYLARQALAAGTEAPAPPAGVPALTFERVERLVTEAAAACAAAGLFDIWKERGRAEQLRRAFQHWNLRPADAAILHGVFRWIAKQSRAGKPI